jgi:hypothetical protein
VRVDVAPFLLSRARELSADLTTVTLAKADVAGVLEGPSETSVPSGAGLHVVASDRHAPRWIFCSNCVS